ATSQRGNPDRPSLGPQRCPMVYDEPLLVLPLVHHLVQQGVQRFLPAVAPDMAAADYDLRLTTLGCRTVVSEPAAHPTRDANWNPAQLSREALGVVDLVPARQLADERRISRVGFLGRAPATRTFRSSNRELQNHPASGAARDAGAAVDEGDDRSPNLL